MNSNQSTLKVVALVLSVMLALPAGAGAAKAPDPPSPAAVGTGTNPPNAASAQLLDANEVADLAARAEEPGQEVTGGALSNEHLTYIVIALAVAVIILVAK